MKSCIFFSTVWTAGCLHSGVNAMRPGHDGICPQCAALEACYEAMLFEQAKLHHQLELAQESRNREFARSLRLEAYRVTARLKDVRSDVLRHKAEPHEVVHAA